ncbi:MAG: GTP-dependent dephospho-CoA kinase family protein [Haloferacaceae archaeon]
MSLLSLPVELREELKEPLGPVFEDPAELLAGAGDPLVAVGDVVTYHLRRAGRDPDVSVIDGKTKREAVGEEIAAVLEGDDHRIRVHNPAGELTAELLRALRTALDRDDPTVIHVDGEEDLATLPAIVAAPLDASVVYGQPGVGMVHVNADAEAKQVARSLLARMDGDSEAAFEILDA